MRVTQQMLNNNFLTNLNQNMSRMEKIQQQMSTGKMINRPSDDPVGLTYSLRYRSELSTNEQYQRNLDSAISWLDYGETTLGQANDILQRVRELTVKGATGSESEESRKAIATEIDQLYEQLRETANSRFNGKYVFNGQKTDQPPYPNADSYLTESFDSSKMSFEVSRGVEIEVNHHAGEIFGEEGEADNAFAVLRQISSALQSGDEEAMQGVLGQLDSRMDKLNERWADLGAKRNRTELIENRLKDEHTNVTTLMSRTEDADMAELITHLRMEENIYRASLSTGARIMQPSLIDFLR